MRGQFFDQQFRERVTALTALLGEPWFRHPGVFVERDAVLSALEDLQQAVERLDLDA